MTMVSLVRSTWAAVWLYSAKIFWYTIISRACPTAAYACFWARLSGFLVCPRAWRPAAMAPEDTSTTSRPSPLKSLIRRIRRSIFSKFKAPVSGWVRDEEPIFITTRFFCFSICRSLFCMVGFLSVSKY